MHLFTDIHSLQGFLTAYKYAGKKIGLVPTMGALHSGHLSLIEKARQECDLVVCSIYVNPTQFNNPNDLVHYPRTVSSDRQLLESVNCDVLFLPDDQVMYPQKTLLKFDFGYLEHVMEGKYRPGHFNGVATVVSKLLHIVKPDQVYFGQKDLQQFAVIRQLVTDLSFGVQLVCCPIIREKDGLAMSSRNVRLTANDRALAPLLYQSLQLAQKWASAMSVEQVKEAVARHLAATAGIQLEYFEIVDSYTLQPVKEVDEHEMVSLCIAAYIGEIRLIDNIFLNNSANYK
ncbi:pantoate--beta-alanine ligase [Rhodocytophaga aerolata]|uniref:Pantothenate synthetase n=1 Tax=Rhodocytophaga aerolata TaxID=455078 RepID=A0ABT8R5Z5_9BACT|nr:pantoate--beta-alanine ligase [Rhodocytophaga aerolata]MDO1447524.1 pantoate--beta-alanine ligase [Rhodocytophaga aerolata]